MNKPITHVLDELVRRCVPFVVCVLFVLVGVLRLPAPVLADAVMMLPLMAVFFWTLHRPAVMPLVAVFAVGLLDDAIRGVPFGFSALLLLLACGFVRSQRKVMLERGPIAHWILFVSVVVFYEIGRLALVFLLGGPLVDGWSAVMRAVSAIVLYPGVSWLMARMHLGLLKQA